ncbi:MAG TPA: DUF4129 domain-containing protein [Anaerolineales bacterium]|nr:DUF4129 domain-containing protein [Anaerolineales bacterium]
MTGSTKRKTIVLLGLVMLLTIVVAANLQQVEFQPGMPLPRLEQGQLVVGAINDPSFSISAPSFILILIALVLTAATLYTAYQIFRGADWQLILSVLRFTLIISVSISCLVFMVMLFPNSNIDTPAEITMPPIPPQPVVTSPVASAPAWLLWLVGAGLLIITVLVALWSFRPVRQADQLDLLGLEAERARRALMSGAELKEVIINCYREMSLTMKQERGIEREEFMTTREFETVMESVGLPPEPIHRLTRLFEAVRYGHWQPNATDEQQAIQSLEAIMVNSRTVRAKNRNA